MAIDLKIGLRCSTHREVELEGKVINGVGYIAPCTVCLLEGKKRHFKEMSDKLLELQKALGTEDIKVIPHIRKKPNRKKTSPSYTDYVCSRCGKSLPRGQLTESENKDGDAYFVCPDCKTIALNRLL